MRDFVARPRLCGRDQEGAFYKRLRALKETSQINATLGLFDPFDFTFDLGFWLALSPWTRVV